MKSLMKYMLLLAMTTMTTDIVAQDLKTGYLSDGFLYRHDINPAIANEEGYFSIPFLGYINADMAGNFGYEDVIKKNPLYPNQSDKKMTSFMNPYLSQQLNGFASGDNIINGRIKETIFSSGFKKWGGYNTLELNVKASANANIPFKLFLFAAEATNNVYNIGDINISAQSYAELSFGHSRKINDKLRVGGKAKLLVGLADAQVKMKNVEANLKDENKWIISADAQADVSMSGFKYLSKTKDYNIQDGTYQHVNDVEASPKGPSGYGLALDAGVVYRLNDDITLSGAIQDLGAIIWTNDHQATNDAKSFVFDGFHDVSVDSSSPDKLDNKADKYTDQMLDFANLRDKGDKGTRVTGVGATVTAAGEYVLPSYRALKLGLMGNLHINGPYTWTEGRVLANISPVDWFDGSVSLGVNNFATCFGFLANFHTKKFNFFLGMDRICTSGLSKEFIPLNSNGGISMGFNIKM